MRQIQSGEYITNIIIDVGDDIKIIITKVDFYKGCSRSETSPADDPYIEVLEAEFEEDNSKALGWEEVLTEEHYEEIGKQFYKEMYQTY